MLSTNSFFKNVILRSHDKVGTTKDLGEEQEKAGWSHPETLRFAQGDRAITRSEYIYRL